MPGYFAYRIGLWNAAWIPGSSIMSRQATSRRVRPTMALPEVLVELDPDLVPDCLPLPLIILYTSHCGDLFQSSQPLHSNMGVYLQHAVQVATPI
jgi:hypothetical protein